MATMHSPPIKAPVTQIISGKLPMITHLPKGRGGRGNKIILQVTASAMPQEAVPQAYCTCDCKQ